MKTFILPVKAATAFVFLVLLTASCKKENNNNGDTNQPPGSNGTDTTGSTGNCTAKKADAENIAIFPADNPWNKDISQSAIDPYNTQIIAALGSYAIKADFGSGVYEGSLIGIPYVVVCGSQTKYA